MRSERTPVCEACYRPEVDCRCSCGFKEIVFPGSAKMKLQNLWLEIPPTVPEARWYVAHELGLDISAVTVGRQGRNYIAVVRGGDLTAATRADVPRLQRAIEALVEPTTEFWIEIRDN